MKKLLYIILAGLSIMTFTGQCAYAQYSDRSETDCNGNVQNLYNTLNSPKVVVICTMAFDCPYCMADAPLVDTFSKNHNDKIRFWAAMSIRHTLDPSTCPEMTTWQSTYGFSKVFSFLDPKRNYVINTWPYYRVIKPSDKSIAYEGTSYANATAMALSLAKTISTSGIESNIAPVLTGINIYSHEGGSITLNASSVEKLGAGLKIYNALGQIVYSSNLQLQAGDNNINIESAGFGKGIYVASINLQGQSFTAKFIR